MKLKEFRKLFRGLPPDTEVMLVADWIETNGEGIPRLESANNIEIICQEPQGLDDDGATVAYLYHSPDKVIKR